MNPSLRAEGIARARRVIRALRMQAEAKAAQAPPMDKMLRAEDAQIKRMPSKEKPFQKRYGLAKTLEDMGLL